jgi:hypothetical protein
MVDQVRMLEMQRDAAEKRGDALETALRAIMEVGQNAAPLPSATHSYAVGRMATIAEFALNPDTHTGGSE